SRSRTARAPRWTRTASSPTWRMPSTRRSATSTGRRRWAAPGGSGPSSRSAGTRSATGHSRSTTGSATAPEGAARVVAMSDVLAFADVTVTRGGNRLLDSVDWEVEEGQRWVVLGPNGAGKTTLLQVASGR